MNQDQFGAAGEDQRRMQSWVSILAVLVLLGYLAVAVVNTLVAATAERSREFALLQLVGSRTRQVRAMMRIESLMVVGIAVVVGSLIALPPLMGIGRSGVRAADPAISPAIYGSIVAVTAVLGFVSIAIPTRAALRKNPMTECVTTEWHYRRHLWMRRPGTRSTKKPSSSGALLPTNCWWNTRRPSPHGQALDLACGEGRNALWLATRGWEVTGIDYSAVAIEKARMIAARSPRSVLDRLDYRCGRRHRRGLRLEERAGIRLGPASLPSSARTTTHPGCEPCHKFSET